MRGLAILTQLFGKWFGVLAPFMPKILVGIYVFMKIFRPITEFGFTGTAFEEMGKTVLAAELTLRNSIDLLYAGTFTYIHVLELLGAIMFIRYAVKLLGDALIGLTGSQAHTMAYVVGAVIFAIIELSAVRFADGAFTFIPIKDGILYFLANLAAFNNFDWWPWNEPRALTPVKQLLEGNVTNTTG